MSEDIYIADETEEEESVKENNKKAKKIAQQADLGFQELLSTENGRAWAWKFIEECGVFRSSISRTPELTYLQEGIRSMGLRVLSDLLTLAPERFLEMVTQHWGKK